MKFLFDTLILSKQFAESFFRKSKMKDEAESVFYIMTNLQYWAPFTISEGTPEWKSWNLFFFSNQGNCASIFDFQGDHVVRGQSPPYIMTNRQKTFWLLKTRSRAILSKKKLTKLCWSRLFGDRSKQYLLLFISTFLWKSHQDFLQLEESISWPPHAEM